MLWMFANRCATRPDRCDGTYDANCDPSRAYTNITSIISSFGKTDLLNYMSTYWKDYQGDDETFWEHEWAKHGTCISTLEPECYPDHKATEEVVDYFQKAVDLFKALPSYEVRQSIPSRSLHMLTDTVARSSRHHTLNHANLHIATDPRRNRRQTPRRHRNTRLQVRRLQRDLVPLRRARIRPSRRLCPCESRRNKVYLPSDRCQIPPQERWQQSNIRPYNERPWLYADFRPRHTLQWSWLPQRQRQWREEGMYHLSGYLVYIWYLRYYYRCIGW
jgi:hypothetical protein